MKDNIHMYLSIWEFFFIPESYIFLLLKLCAFTKKGINDVWYINRYGRGEVVETPYFGATTGPC